MNKIIVTIASAFLLSSCVPLMIGTGVTAGGYMVRNKTGIGGKVSDVELLAKVDYALGKLSHKLKRDIFYAVKNGEVLLTGSAPDKEAKQDIVNCIKKINNVVVVHDEVLVGEKYSFVEACSDNLMIADFNARVLMNKKTKSLNYKVIIFKHNIYLIGSVDSEDELNSVINIAKSLVGVKKIISFLKVTKKNE